MTKEELYQNAFIESIIDLTLSTQKEWAQKKYDELSSHEKYLLDISKYNNNLLQTLNEIESVIVFLKRFPQKKFYADNNINEIYYTKYHMEVYYHKLFTTSELLRLLINKIYALDLKEKQCSGENLIKKIGEKDPVIILLQDFEKKVIFYRRKRNKSAHYGDFSPDINYDKVLLLNDYKHFVDYLNIEQDENEIGKFNIDHTTRNYRKEQITRLTKNLNVIRQYINLFYDIWINIFIQTLEEMTTLNTSQSHT